MEHDYSPIEHDHHHHHHHEHSPKSRLLLASGLCFVFFLVELIAGYCANSIAILLDSFHLLSDLSGFLISLGAMYLSKRKATRNHSFGYHRAEILGALLSVLLIWIVTGFLVMEAVERVRNPQPVDGKVMLSVAIVGLIVNLVMVLALGHDHGNINVRSAVIHILGDIISSVGVVVSSIVVYVRPDYMVVDPICTFVFSVVVLCTTFNILSDSVHVLMEGTPSSIDSVSLEQDLLAIEHVTDVHDLHIWTLTIGKPALAVHIEATSDVLHSAQEMLCEKYNIHHTTIQIEDRRAAHCDSVCNGGVCEGFKAQV